jgi:glycosyltransferase involved in cell wall biosynthesis
VGISIKKYENMTIGKPVMTTKFPGVMKGFSEDNGVIYGRGPEGALKKAIELIERGDIEQEGIKARKFVEDNDWEKITDEFERVLASTTHQRET